MKLKGTWRDLPGYWINGDERWIATMYGWNKLKEIGREFYRFCELRRTGCQGTGCEWHHRHGRGGGKRDDRIELPSGRRMMFWTCRTCHDQVRIERKYAETGQGGREPIDDRPRA